MPATPLDPADLCNSRSWHRKTPHLIEDLSTVYPGVELTSPAPNLAPVPGITAVIPAPATDDGPLTTDKSKNVTGCYKIEKISAAPPAFRKSANAFVPSPYVTPITEPRPMQPSDV